MKKFWFVFALLGLPVFAAEVAITVSGHDGLPVSDAVVLIYADDQSQIQPKASERATMQQIDKQFLPHVLPVSIGTSVEFPNADSVKHHVYSFSDAKTFELELYDDFQGKPISFDKPGIVELGCNIHDWMLAYIYVTDADYFFTSSEQGTVTASLPTGSYTVQLWHPRAQSSDTQLKLTLTINASQTLELSFKEEFDEALDFSSGFDDY